VSVGVLKPKDLLVRRLREHAVEPLRERGFKFAASGPHFTRTHGIARQRVDFSLSRWNQADRAEFWTMWEARAPGYLRWHEAEWGTPAPNDGLGGLAEWNIPGWPRGHAHFELTNSAQDETEMLELLRAIDTAGLPFLDAISTWEGAAEHLRTQRSRYDRAADFLIIAELRDRALATLQEGIRSFEVEGRPDHFNELPRIRARLSRYFPGVGPTGA
jgi:hypothetical protein